MSVKLQRKLSDEESLVWKFVLEFNEKTNGDPGVAIIGSNAYYFSGQEYWFFRDPSEVFKLDPEISWEKLAAVEKKVQIKAKGPPYYDKKEREFNEGPRLMTVNGPILYLLSGHSKPEQYLKGALTDLSESFSLLEFEHSGSIEVTSFPGLNAESIKNDSLELREFFQERRISFGTYDLCRINDTILDLIFQRDQFDDLVEAGSIPRITSTTSYGASNEANSLGFDGKTSQIYFQFGLTRDPGLTDEVLVRGLMNVFAFIFEGVETFLSRRIDFSEYLSWLLGGPIADLELLLNPKGGIDLFFERWNNEPDLAWQRGSDSRLWVSPELVQIFITTPKFDPSFGTSTEYSQETLVLAESRRNFKKTNFEAISISSYIERLARQGLEYSHLDKTFGP